MADSRTPLISGIVTALFIVLSTWGFACADEPSEPQDSTKTTDVSRDAVEEPALIDDAIDSDYIVEDADFIGPIDPSRIKPVIRLPEPPEYKPYYTSYISARSLGDYLRNGTGFFVLQHGSVGQPEMITKSVMLPGMQAVYNDVPVFHQGSYFPFRSGPDMNVLMADNLYDYYVTPISYLSPLTQGELVSLESSPWPSIDNLSSVAVAQGPYELKKSAWRFSRRFTKTTGLIFTASFKKARGFYSTSGDYDDFKIAGTFAWRPRVDTEIIYNFYQYKTKEGLVQFDRAINPTLRSRNDMNLHSLKGKFRKSNNLTYSFEAFRQHNYNHIFDNSISFDDLIKDDIYGAVAAIDYNRGVHNFHYAIAGKQHHLRATGSSPIIRIGAVLGSDSLIVTEDQYVVMTGRLRYNRLSKVQPAGSVRYIRPLAVNLQAEFSGGVLDYDPDIYAMYYSHPRFETTLSDLVRSYEYHDDDNLDAKRIYFGKVALESSLAEYLTAQIGLTAEKVNDDLIPVISQSDSNWTSTENNIDYKRFTLTADLRYSLTKYFNGSSGLTYFHYNPSEALPGIKHSPSLMAFSYGEFKVREVLEDIDLSGAFQVRYYGKRYYSGILDQLTGDYTYDPAIVIDGSLAIKFGTFEFRITEDNILDFLGGNDYTLWGDYSMPPGMVWWHINWNFKN
jgi:hypothetical protein